MNESRQISIPDTSNLELFFTGIKAAIAAIPFAGGSLAELVGYFGQRYTSERQKRFLEELLQQLNALSERTDNLPATLAGNETFYSTLSYALSALQHTSEQQKIDALRNVVVTAATAEAPDKSQQDMFVRFIAELTPWHLMLLDCIFDPVAWADKRSIPVYTKEFNAASLFEAATREELQLSGFHTVLLQDLYTRGLATTGVDPYGPPIARGENDVFPRITGFGREFLRCIMPPKSAEEP